MNASHSPHIYISKTYFNNLMGILFDLNEAIESSLKRSEQIIEQALVGYETLIGSSLLNISDKDNWMEYIHPEKLKQKLNRLVLERLQASQQIHTSIIEPLKKLCSTTNVNNNNKPIIPNQQNDKQMELFALEKILKHLERKYLETGPNRALQLSRDMEKIKEEIEKIKLEQRNELRSSNGQQHSVVSSIDKGKSSPPQQYSSPTIFPPKVTFQSIPEHFISKYKGKDYWAAISNASSPFDFEELDIIKENHHILYAPKKSNSSPLNQQISPTYSSLQTSIHFSPPLYSTYNNSELNNNVNEQSVILSKEEISIISSSESESEGHLLMPSNLTGQRYEVEKENYVLNNGINNTKNKEIKVKKVLKNKVSTTKSKRASSAPKTTKSTLETSNKKPSKFKSSIEGTSSKTKKILHSAPSLPNHKGLKDSLRLAITPATTSPKKLKVSE
ncbi:hypothetical protein ABK040_008806 [Willaertia magna]